VSLLDLVEQLNRTDVALGGSGFRKVSGYQFENDELRICFDPIEPDDELPSRISEITRQMTVSSEIVEFKLTIEK
jgi:hypothetical protein